MKRPGEEDRPPGGNAERRRRQFEDSRGLSERPELPLEEEPETPEHPSEDDDAPAAEETDRDA